MPGRLVVAAVTVALALPALASAHVERSSYWPDPAPDRSITPAAGGEVPRARTLASALRPTLVGQTRVVCKPDSLRAALTSIRVARSSGFRLRPSQSKRKLSASEAQTLERINRRLFESCEYRHIQAAVFDSGNNDRIVVMPGTYLEQPSRAQPSDDPKCARFAEPSENGSAAASYRYQVRCPNDQSLIYVQGRALTDEPVPYPPLEDRHLIPDEGRCVRCNLQIEGSGVLPTDVLIDAAEEPGQSALRETVDAAKDVGMRVDRADGFVIRNMTFAHAHEHGLYIHETDGYLSDRTEWYYNGLYGLLVFTSDHGLTENCEGVGHGDSAVYPGSSADTGEQRRTDLNPRSRQNQTIRFCDIHHNTLGYSGTMGNATKVVHNEFYDNGTAIATESFFAGGHPGYPQDSAVFAHNDIYSNNFNSFVEESDVVPRVPTPVGLGVFIAGGNNNEIHHNRIWDNHYRGTMLLAIPDVLSFSDDPTQVQGVNSTGHRNRYHDNVMGIAPGGKQKPNGVDFWWDEFPATEDNCWFRNGEVTSDPPAPLLPSNCENSAPGLTYAEHFTGEIAGCLVAVGVAGEYDPNLCPWFKTPPEPSSGSSVSSATAASAPPGLGEVRRRAATYEGLCGLLGDDTLSCSAFQGRRP